MYIICCNLEDTADSDVLLYFRRFVVMNSREHVTDRELLLNEPISHEEPARDSGQFRSKIPLTPQLPCTPRQTPHFRRNLVL